MLHNNEGIRQAIAGIILYDAVIPPRMVSELRTIVSKLDENMREGKATVHGATQNHGMLGIYISGICEVTIEHNAGDTNARISLDDGQVTIASDMCRAAYAFICEELMGTTEQN